MAMTLVSTVTVGSGGAASVTISNIPQTAKDILILVSSRTNHSGTGGDYQILRFNGDSSTIYPNRYLFGDGSTASSGSTNDFSTFFWFGNTTGTTANTFSNSQIYVTNYTASATKSVSVDSVTENNATAAQAALTASAWPNNAAINSVFIAPYFGTSFAQHTSVSLYLVS